MQEQFIVNYFTLGLFFIVSIIFVPAIIFLTKFLAPHNPSEEKLITYECGIISHFYIRYYIFAFLFVIFDVEVVFLFPWAVHFRVLGLAGFIEVLIFILVLILGLVYVWRKGILKWVT